jgi:arylsulfatase A-like enzyme
MQPICAKSWAAGLLLCVAFASDSRLIAADTPHPNVVLLMADDQGFGDVAYNGNPAVKTPVLDSMAASGLRFDRFYAAAPVCSPTRCSVLTGRHPNRIGCFSWGRPLRSEEITLAELLQQAGYATGHFGKWHLGALDEGSPVSPGAKGFQDWFSSPNFFENSPMMCQRGKVVQTEGEGSRVIVDAALEFMRAAVANKQPFFSVVWFGSPHGPHRALDDDRALYAEHPAAMQNYWGEITAMDRAVGHLRSGLRAMGAAEDTLIWYTSDNGAMGVGSTGGLRGQKATLWEGGLRVPGIVEWPARIKSPMRISLPCCSVDILPTILELVGAKLPERPLDGISLVPLFDGKLQSRTKPLGFWVYPEPGIGVNSTALLEALSRGERTEQAVSDAALRAEKKQYPEKMLPGHAAWVDANWKLHRIADRMGQGRYELYDLAADPHETTDVAAKDPSRVTEMTSQLAKWQLSVVRSLNGEDY